MKTLKLSFFILFIAIAGKGFGQVAINTDGSTPATNAMLDITSTTRGILIPRMLESDRLALTPSDGLLVYQTNYDTYPNGFYYYDNEFATWKTFASGVIPITSGGTGATDAGTARTNLGLGTLSTLNIINNTYWSGQGLSVGNGGTGLTSASAGQILTGGGGANPLVLVATLGVSRGGTGASTLTGYVKGAGTSALTATTTIPGKDVVATVTTYNATTTLTISDQVVICSANTFTVNLPSASGNTGRQYTIKNIGSGTITIGGTVDATVNPTLAQWAFMTVVSDGTNWYKIGQ